MAFLLLLLVLLMALAMVALFLGTIFSVALFLIGVTILFTCGRGRMCGGGRIDGFLWYMKNSVISLAIALVGLMVTQAGGWIINKHQEHLQKTPEYQEAIKKNAEALDRFFSQEPMAREEMWWIDLSVAYPDRYLVFSRLRLKPYQETIKKYLGPCPDTDRDWEKYFDEKVWPALHNNIKVVYCPQPPPAAEAVP